MQRYIFYFKNANILNIIFNSIVKFYTKIFGIMKLHWLKFGIVIKNLYLCIWKPDDVIFIWERELNHTALKYEQVLDPSA